MEKRVKARVKATGEIVNLASYATIALERCDSWGNPIELKPEEVELIQPIQEQTKDEHWQEVRERAAIAAMQGMLANPELIEYMDDGSKDYKLKIEKRALTYADALIDELKSYI